VLSKQVAITHAGSGPTGPARLGRPVIRKGNPRLPRLTAKDKGKTTSPEDVQRQIRIKGAASNAFALRAPAKTRR
jgi:hypothetical protein